MPKDHLPTVWIKCENLASRSTCHLNKIQKSLVVKTW